ncbi:hypothetical protein BAU07_26360 (plasmid) [Bordetella flabilis]|uniref:Uncharacterized protein n=2 Tax=Bordetella flabilis TaxID=463014 RepID=A0A193GML7_9BORD|nr:hypothetical protein BAU07_26360 [Bordetella flabilis]
MNEGDGPQHFMIIGHGPQHFMIIGPTGKGRSQLLQAEADRLGISYEELERRLEPTPEQKERARMRQEEEDRRDAQRLDAVRKAYWVNTDESDSDLYALSDALSAAGIASDPTVEQRRILFMMLPANVIGQGLAWGFSDTEVRGQVHAFVAENRDAVARAVSA